MSSRARTQLGAGSVVLVVVLGAAARSQTPGYRVAYAVLAVRLAVALIVTYLRART